MEPCKVVNIKAYPERKLPANVAYCGRLSKNDPGPYGNPYEIGRDGTRDEVCDKWDIELKLRLQDPAYEARMMRDLDGKDLACFCFPLRCHCQSTLREVGDRSQFPDRYPQFQRANERDRRAILITEDKPSTQESAPPQGRRLGIIGTAGRKDDRPRMSTALQVRMGDAARAVVQAKEFNRLVSGGAAWADHVAVQLALDGTVKPSNLTLHLPAKLGPTGFDETTRDGSVANYYHRLFRDGSGIDGLAQLREVISAGADWTVNERGFKARNADVARDSDGLLAFTFGHGEPWKAKVHRDVNADEARLKDGGTADTWNKSRATLKIHVTLLEI